MSDPDRIKAFSRLLGRAGRAHHEAIGGPSDTWATWYAEHLHADIAEHVGYQPSLDEVADWLTRADEQHRAESPDTPWPPVYAELILGWVEADDASG